MHTHGASIYSCSVTYVSKDKMGAGIGGPSTTHCGLAPLHKEPSRISLMYLIFLETRIIHLHFPADSLCLSLFNFLADRTDTQYDRLLAAACCPSVRLSVTLCIVAVRVGVQR